MASYSSPSFFKVLFDPSAPQLPLPSDFVSLHLKNKIPNDPIIRYTKGGYSWKLKIKKVGEFYFFTDGWNNVVKDINLGQWDLLVFWLVEESIFELLIFSPNCCEKDLPPKMKVHDNGIVDEDVIDDDDDDGEGEDNDGDEDDEDENDDEEDQDEDEDENEDEDDDDDDDDDEDEDVDDDDDDKDVDNDEDEDGEGEDNDGDDEEEDDDDRNGETEARDGDPFFESIISKTHNLLLRLPTEFVELTGMNCEADTIIVKNLLGEESQVALRWDKRMRKFYLSSGWPNFLRSNKLSEGDKCLFKFLKSEGILCLAKITKNKGAEKKSPPLGKFLKTDVVKRKRGPPKLEQGSDVDVESEDDCFNIVE